MLKLKTKECNKISANAVGADVTFRMLFREHTKNTPAEDSNPNSKFQTLTSAPKGITLIALIITIIVMLILVGVTINIALNGGLFNKAETATKKTQKEIEEETLIAAIASAYDEQTGKIGKIKLESDLGDMWKVTGKEGGTYGVTSPKGNIFAVKQTGEIITEAWIDNGDDTYTKGNKTVTKGKTLTNGEVQEMLETKGGTYSGTWTVLGVEDDKLKLVSTSNVINNIHLGRSDPRATDTDVPGHLENDATDFEKAVWSYAHTVETLNRTAKDATGIDSARSIKIEDIYDIIGEDAVDKGTDYGKVYNYYFNDEDSKVYLKFKASTDEEYGQHKKTSYDTQIFVRYPDKIEENSIGERIIISSENSDGNIELTQNFFSYTLKDNEKIAVGSLASGDYWLANPCVGYDDFHSSATFWIRRVKSGLLGADHMFNSAQRLDGPRSEGVRAIVYI